MSDNIGKQYTINRDGCKLQVIGDEFRFINKHNQAYSLRLSDSCKQILRKLLESPSTIVSYDILYDTYSSTDEKDGISPKNALHKIKSTMDPLIKDYLVATKGRGYSLPDIEYDGDILLVANSDVSSLDDTFGTYKIETTEQFPPEIVFLSGEYFAFYISPENSQLLGGYIYLQNIEDNIIVHAILDIRNNDDLLQVPDIFSVKDNYFSHIKYENYKKLNRSNLYVGKLEKCSDYVTAITLKRKVDLGSWKIILNLEDFMKHPRDYTKENNLYRGGLGLKLGGHTDNVSACRIALIRKSLFDTKCMGLTSEDLTEFLTTKNGYVNITAESDKEFYLWLRGHYSDLDD